MSKENKTSDKHKNGNDFIAGVSGSAFLQIGRWIEKMFCKHKDRTELYRCYQERYAKDVCNDCGKIIYEDI